MPSTRTRRALLAAGSAALASLAGCIAGGPAGTTDDTETTDEGLPPSRTATPTGDPVSVERTVEDEDLEYLESENAVRYVAAWRGVEGNGSEPTREPVYETIPFGRWAETECTSVAAQAARRAVRERIDGPVDGISGGMGVPRDGGSGGDGAAGGDGNESNGRDESGNGSADGGSRDREIQPHVTYRIVLDRDGNVISEPSVPFEDVVAATPTEVSATVTFAGRSHTCTERIALWRVVIQQG